MTERVPRVTALPTSDLDRISPASAARGGGAGSHELETSSDDPAMLRQMIERARERLAFYESFDRIIGENIRRSGELMLETIALREEAQATEAARLAREAAITQDREDERARMHGMLTTLRGEMRAFQATAATLLGKIDDALQTVAPQANEPDAPAVPDPAAPAGDDTAAPEPGSSRIVEGEAAGASDAVRDDLEIPEPQGVTGTSFRPIRHTSSPLAGERSTVVQEPLQAEAPAAEETRRTVDVVVNGITRATTALAFQRALGTKPGVLHVETREFAEGVLRLSTTIAGEDALSDAMVAAWSGPGSIRVVTRQPTLLALDLID